MKIRFESAEPNSNFVPITFYDYETFVNEFKIYPTTMIRDRYISNGIYLLSYTTGLFKYPRRLNKEIDNVFGDGLTHYNASYKADPYTIGIFVDSNEYINMLAPIYLTRGTLKCTVTTDWGTINTFNCRVIQFNEYNSELLFDNPSTNVDTVQDTTYYFSGESITSRLFPTDDLNPDDSLYPYTLVKNVKFDVANVVSISQQNTIWKFTISTTSDNMYLNNIVINGSGWKIPPKHVIDGDIIEINVEEDTVKLNNVNIGTYTGDVGEIHEVNWIEIRMSNETDVQTTIEKVNVDLNIKGSSNGNILIR